MKSLYIPSTLKSMFKLYILVCQVEIQVKKMYCVNRAEPNLPFNFEDAAHIEESIPRVKEVCKVHYMKNLCGPPPNFVLKDCLI